LVSDPASLLAKSVANRHKGEVEFVEESWATSALAQRMGVKYYPAIFVNDVLVARPGDFRAKDGRYSPWIGNAKAHERFQADLARMVDLARKGRMDVVRKESDAAPAAEVAELPRIPALTLQPLTGEALDLSKRDGTVRIVEFWATWCPPCRGTLSWLSELQAGYGGRVQVLGIAVESEEPAVRAMAEQLKLGYPVAMTTPEAGAAYGDVLSVPTLFVFDKAGNTAKVFYGAPEGLHESVKAELERLLR
jgi:thiol-disulfide isomerase/thioredoxin